MGPGRLRTEPFGVVAGSDQQGGRGVDADSIDGEQFGSSDLEKRGDHGVELSDLGFEFGDAVSQRGERRLGGRGHRIRRARRTQALGGSDELGDGEALEPALQLVRGTEGELAHLAERLDARPTNRALGHDEDADGLDRTVSGLAVVEQQSVTVTDEEAPMVSVEASGNTSSIVLKDKDLDSLSDDPDELSNELTALAGPSAGPNGGEVYISGFTGGQLPPKSAIREIRINQNPFSAEFDHLGYGRIEILTKPGTDKLHGRFFAQGNDDAFNTGNPFTTVLPAYHSIQYNGLDQRIDLEVGVVFSQRGSAQQSERERLYGNYGGSESNDEPLQRGQRIPAGLFSPSTHTEVSPRIDLQLGQKNTLTLRYQFERYNQSGGIGSLQLPIAVDHFQLHRTHASTQ